MMATTETNEQGRAVGIVYADITLTNMFSGKTLNARALVDTGSTHMVLPARVAIELGFDLEEVTVSHFIVADARRVRCPQVAPIKVGFLDRAFTTDAAVFGDECLMGVVALEMMDLVVDPKGQCVIPNPQHPDGPLFRI